jgi:hypothetical protein
MCETTNKFYCRLLRSSARMEMICRPMHVEFNMYTFISTNYKAKRQKVEDFFYIKHTVNILSELKPTGSL